MSDVPISNQPGESATSPVRIQRSYWDGRFVFTMVVLISIAILAAYLQYDVYRSILQNPPFLESSVTLHLSFFNYAYDAYRCANGTLTPVSSCPITPEHIIGVPAFDFFQLFVVIIIFANLYHFYSWRKSF